MRDMRSELANKIKEENMDNYVIRLKKMAVSCDYAQDTVSDMIRDQIVDSCQSNELRKKILKERNLTLTKIQEISRASELADLHCNKIDQQRKNHKVRQHRKKKIMPTKLKKINLERSSIIRVHNQAQLGGQN